MTSPWYNFICFEFHKLSFSLWSTHFLFISLSLSTRAVNKHSRRLLKVLQSRRRLEGALNYLVGAFLLRGCKSSHNHREPWFAALLCTDNQVLSAPAHVRCRVSRVGPLCCSPQTCLLTTPGHLAWPPALHCSFWLFREWQNAHTKCSTGMYLPMYIWCISTARSSINFITGTLDNRYIGQRLSVEMLSRNCNFP